MSLPQRVPDSGDPGSIPTSRVTPLRPSAQGPPNADDSTARAREQAEAEAAVAAVMQGVREKAAAAERSAPRVDRGRRLRVLLLAVLILVNFYAWFGNPQWLQFREPQVPDIHYYEASWKVAVYLQRQRIEEYRREQGKLPATAQQAGPVVKGVRYTPIREQWYDLSVGEGTRRFVWRSTDSVSVLIGRALVQMGLFTGGVR